MDEPYFDEGSHLYAIDVYLNGFDYVPAAGCRIVIDYDPDDDILLSEPDIESSLLASFGDIGATFDFSSPGEILLGGIQPPLDDGPIVVTNSSQKIFTIYFTATARSCRDFSFADTRMLVSFPSLNTWNLCYGPPGMDCEPEDVCIAGFTLGGLIESPVLDCDGAEDGGIPNVAVHVVESYDTDLFGCESNTDAYGTYECDVVADMDYRVTPENDYDVSCGISSLDIDILMDYLLGENCLDYIWQLLAGDVDGSGTVAGQDLTEMAKAIMQISVTWPSWRFVPAASYTGMDLPDCYDPGFDAVPAYDPYIDVEDVDQDYDDLDFVGIKMGDLNGTCTNCSESFTGGEHNLIRSAPIDIDISKQELDEYALSFSRPIKGLKVLFFAFTADEEPTIIYSSFTSNETLQTLYKDGIFYVGYVSFTKVHELFRSGEPFLRIKGKLGKVVSAGNAEQNEIISEDNYSTVSVLQDDLKRNVIFPNPSPGEFYTNPNFAGHQSVKFEIFTSEGQLISDYDVPNEIEKQSLSLMPGVYFYRFHNDVDEYAGKIVITK